MPIGDDRLTQSEFIAHVRALAADTPGLNPEAAAAHAANESAFGKSELAATYGNLFGVKAGSSWTGATVELPTWEVRDGKTVHELARFRAYASWLESLVDYADLAARLYPWAVQYRDNPLSWLTGLFVIGPRRWATDPAAYAKAVAILDQFDLLRAPGAEREQLGEHQLLVDNSPSLGKAVAHVVAALTGKPAVFGPHAATRTLRPDRETWKLDVRALK